MPSSYIRPSQATMGRHFRSFLPSLLQPSAFLLLAIHTILLQPTLISAQSSIGFPIGFVGADVYDGNGQNYVNKGYLLNLARQTIVGGGNDSGITSQNVVTQCAISPQNGVVYLTSLQKYVSQVTLTPRGPNKGTNRTTPIRTSLVDVSPDGKVLLLADAVFGDGAVLVSSTGGSFATLIKNTSCSAAAYCGYWSVVLACSQNNVNWTIYSFSVSGLAVNFAGSNTRNFSVSYKPLQLSCSPEAETYGTGLLMALAQSPANLWTYDWPINYKVRSQSSLSTNANPNSFAFDATNKRVLVTSGGLDARPYSLTVDYYSYNSSGTSMKEDNSLSIATQSSNGGQIIAYDAPNYAYIALPEGLVVVPLGTSLSPSIQIWGLESTNYGAFSPYALCSQPYISPPSPPPPSPPPSPPPPSPPPPPPSPPSPPPPPEFCGRLFPNYYYAPYTSYWTSAGSIGTFMQPKSVNDCFIMCGTTPGCVGWSYRGKGCYLRGLPNTTPYTDIYMNSYILCQYKP